MSLLAIQCKGSDLAAGRCQANQSYFFWDTLGGDPYQGQDSAVVIASLPPRFLGPPVPADSSSVTVPATASSTAQTLTGAATGVATQVLGWISNNLLLVVLLFGAYIFLRRRR